MSALAANQIRIGLPEADIDGEPFNVELEVGEYANLNFDLWCYALDGDVSTLEIRELDRALVGLRRVDGSIDLEAPRFDRLVVSHDAAIRLLWPDIRASEVVRRHSFVHPSLAIDPDHNKRLRPSGLQQGQVVNAVGILNIGELYECQAEGHDTKSCTEALVISLERLDDDGSLHHVKSTEDFESYVVVLQLGEALGSAS